MEDRETIYYRFFAAVDSIEQVLNEVQRRTGDFDEDITDMRNDLEQVVDRTISQAAAGTWALAVLDSGFEQFARDYEEFSFANFRSFL